MPHLNDYLEKNADKSLSKMPFNELDFALLSQISYLDLEDIVSDGPEKISFADAYKLYVESGKKSENGNAEKLFKAVAESDRYKKLKMSHFLQTENPETCEQFGAYALDIGLNHKAVFFRPTNGSLYAWHDNFIALYKKSTPTQERATEYFNRLAFFHPFQRFTLCGHSKGGNNAMYAAAKTSLFNQAKIKQVLNFDGPGFNTQMTSPITNPLLIDKVTSIMPEASIIGRLLDHNEKMVVVKSREPDGIGMHDLNEWEVGETSFIRGNGYSYKSDLIERKIKEVVNKLNHEQREKLIEGFFNILDCTGYSQLDDVFKNPKSLFHAYFKSDKDKRVVVRNVALKFLRDRKFMKAVFGKNTEKIENFMENQFEAENKLEEEERKVLAMPEPSHNVSQPQQLKKKAKPAMVKHNEEEEAMMMF